MRAQWQIMRSHHVLGMNTCIDLASFLVSWGRTLGSRTQFSSNKDTCISGLYSLHEHGNIGLSTGVVCTGHVGNHWDCCEVIDRKEIFLGDVTISRTKFWDRNWFEVIQYYWGSTIIFSWHADDRMSLILSLLTVTAVTKFHKGAVWNGFSLFSICIHMCVH